MDGKFLHWRKFAKMDHFRACPICGKSIQFHMYPEEIAVRAASGAAVIYGFWWAKQRGGGWFAMLATVAIAIGAAFLLVGWRLKDKQRFRKA
jgi:hypothetical protein